MADLAAAYDRHALPLFRYAVTLLGSRHDAEDAVQEAFVGVARARPAVADDDALKAYLFTAVRHAAAKVAARRVATADAAEVAAPPPRPPGDDLDAALAALPYEQREVIALKIDGGLTFREIAACLGISPNTAASRYRYALEKLRAAFGEAGRDA
jgi:RNA polymerase sigma-70 factor (ECF subfamily)